MTSESLGSVILDPHIWACLPLNQLARKAHHFEARRSGTLWFQHYHRRDGIDRLELFRSLVPVATLQQEAARGEARQGRGIWEAERRQAGAWPMGGGDKVPGPMDSLKNSLAFVRPHFLPLSSVLDHSLLLQL